MASGSLARFRMFAGPNGSGKSELFNYLRSRQFIHTELYVSADRIEKQLQTTGKFHFNAYRVHTDAQDFYRYVENHGLWPNLGFSSADKLLELTGGVLTIRRNNVDSYVASFTAGYLCDKIFSSQQSFCFETVMSHEDKVRARYSRSLQNLPAAVRACDVAYLIDNTHSDFKIVAEKRKKN